MGAIFIGCNIVMKCQQLIEYKFETKIDMILLTHRCERVKL